MDWPAAAVLIATILALWIFIIYTSSRGSKP